MLAVACTIDEPTYIDPNALLTPDASDGAGGSKGSTPAGKAGSGATGETDGGAAPPDAGKGPGMIPDPPPGCTEGETRPCGPDRIVGICQLGKRTCQDGSWGECEGAVLPAARDCSSPLDNDCDGQPDNTVDDVCQCPAGTTDPCDTHPGFDGHGPCQAGSRSCILADDNSSSAWGECTGSVGPAVKDSCSVRGDDADCDGTPNGGCTCIEGEVIACGPEANVGICKRGTSTCVNNAFTACAGAVSKQPRDCTSEEDNDCDGEPDNSIDDVCACEIGAVRACGTHPGLDGKGPCKAGQQTCVAGADNRTSAWGACVGSVGPGPRSCNAAAGVDNDCDGSDDNTIDATCACVIGEVAACDEHPGLDGIGPCRAGQKLCIAGPNNSSSSYGPCQGAVGPLPSDSCAVLGDNSNCSGGTNEGCECVANQSSEDSLTCQDPAASRCTAGGACVACASDADCSHLTPLVVCDAVTKTCVAAVPPTTSP